MKRLSLLVLGYAVSGCGGALVVRADVPPPPTVAVDAQVGVDAAPEVTTADPEEVTATTEPPDPVYEEQLDPIGPGYFWVGGSWAWTGSDWAWGPGRWLQQPEGRLYVSPYYERVGGRVVFVRGYWGAPGAPARSYGGDRLVFTAAVRPANYHRGDPVHVARSGGAPPGSRPASFYAHATGTVRPVPTATAPSRVAARDTHPETGHDTHPETAHDTHPETGHDTHPETAHDTHGREADPTRDGGHDHMADHDHPDQGHADQSHTEPGHPDLNHPDHGQNPSTAKGPPPHATPAPTHKTPPTKKEK
jgi:hypothetical protein